MGLSETIVKLIFWPRVRKAKRIGEAAELIGQGRAEETLKILARMERRIPPYVGHLFFLTRGRALDELRRWEEAEQAYIAAVFAKQGATIAYIHLAVLCGRQRRFEEARQWLRRIHDDEESEEELISQARELEEMLDDVENGRRLQELQKRATEFEQERKLSREDPARALAQLDEWIDGERDAATAECDEIACYLGEHFAREENGQWLVSLSIEDCSVEAPKGTLNPFALVTQRLEEGGRLEDLLESELTPPLEQSRTPPDLRG